MKQKTVRKNYFLLGSVKKKLLNLKKKKIVEFQNKLPTTI